MVKLYYTPTSCGASNFIAAFAAGLSIECETVTLATHTTASGVDFYTINPKGNVPTLVLDDGTILNENAATLQWICDQKPGTVGPENGTVDRYVLQQALSYISGEFHATIGQLFYKPSPEVTEYIMKKVHMKLKYLNDSKLAGKKFILGDKVSVADFYLYIVISWHAWVNVDISGYPVVVEYFNRVKDLDVVKAATARMNGEVPPTTTV